MTKAIDSRSAPNTSRTESPYASAPGAVKGGAKLARVSAAVICLDEARDLPACLESLRWCDEIVVVVDSRTTDRTAEIAATAGARVFLREWEGWTPQRNFAFGQCTGDWILSVDADERVPPDLAEEIRATIARKEAVNGYYLPRRNLWMGKWIKHGGWYPDHTLRLFRRGLGQCRYLVHERVEVPEPTAVLECALVHDNIKNLNEHLLTALRATDAEAKEMVQNGVRFYALFPWQPIVGYVRDFLRGPRTRLRAYLLAKQHFKNKVEITWLVPFAPLTKFLDMYLVKTGYRDGFHGFWIAAFSAIYVVLKYAKYWALTRTQSAPSTI
jgi:glycosyltransferase involved in cell wall biosynthesis